MKNLNDSGFTLVELLVSATILAIGLLAVAGLQVTAIKGNFHGNAISQATFLAEERIEQIRNMAYDDIYTPDSGVAANPYLEANINGTMYSRETLVESDTPISDLKRITVTVRWQANGPKQVILRTIVANGG